jgi:hypothetical protein
LARRESCETVNVRDRHRPFPEAIRRLVEIGLKVKK